MSITDNVTVSRAMWESVAAMDARIARTLVLVEGLRRGHQIDDAGFECPALNRAPCECGAVEHNARVDAALAVLRGDAGPGTTEGGR